jgi:hypothetical protein
VSSHADYIYAIERRLEWLRWVKSGTGRPTWEALGFGPAMPAYEDVLETADSYFMDAHFCRLVDHARQTIPDEFAFHQKWLQSPRGWVWLAEPFTAPSLDPEAVKEWERHHQTEAAQLKVRAVGWRTIPAGTQVQDHHSGEIRVAGHQAVQFITFQDFRDYNPVFPPETYHNASSTKQGFGCWSYFILSEGGEVGKRVELFESKQATGQYKDVGGPVDRKHHPLHEIRWVYAAVYLMAQRLATSLPHKLDRATQRRIARSGESVQPIFRVITLRRLAAARQRGGLAVADGVDWQWQWEVRGHWRNQFHPSDGHYEPKFVEAYVKGPADKPLKPGTHKLFAARR